MSDAWIDPVERLAKPQALDLGDLDLDVVDRQLGIVKAVDAGLGVVVIDKTREVAIPRIVPFSFTQGDLDAIAEADTLQITDKNSDERGKQILKALKSMRRSVTDWYEDLRAPYRTIVDAVLDMNARDGKAVVDAEKALGLRLTEFDTAEKRREQLERERLQAEADARAREERDREAAAVRRVAEQQERPEVREALTREANALAARPVAAAKVTVVSNRASVRGVSVGVETVDGEVLDKKKFLKAVIAGKIPLDAVEIKSTWVKGEATKWREKLSEIYPFLRLTKSTGTRG